MPKYMTKQRKALLSYLSSHADEKLSAKQHIDPAYQPFGDGHTAEKICDVIREKF